MSFVELCLAVIAWKMLFPGDLFEDNYEGEAEVVEKIQKRREFWGL